ncbi:FeoB small GTPase domain-containing protein [Alkaliphilus sp. B6464]|uniref:FeoB small GTPase domain-containing protein n=1 Tax=Alkaliphilus sp. B6464 TaxID=2731219 RepID=UPI001BA817C6|nr:FeoB small GTPase domain-containing protein [Alkaliphilus sp. B6464]QUH20271.1 50S ribosome-binding GTPase [Alkaliphilus sp. B6464]
MGLTHQSCGKAVLSEKFNIKLGSDDELVIALAGNPNVGKSTVFNALTGLNQHTGNWPGKTVANARGNYTHKDKKFVLVDLPGTYSLLANSVEEQVARDFICFGQPNATIVVTDATCLERNLNLVMQVMELTDKVVLCVNLMDEAKRKGITVNIQGLEEKLGIPVVATTARNGSGLNELMDRTYNIALGIENTFPKTIEYPREVEEEIDKLSERLQNILKDKLNSRWVALRLIEGDTTILDSIGKFLFDYNTQSIEKEEACIYEY